MLGFRVALLYLFVVLVLINSADAYTCSCPNDCDTVPITDCSCLLWHLECNNPNTGGPYRRALDIVQDDAEDMNLRTT